ncbi:amidase [Arenibaculum pallidiluteum]|uniref:amidase n=1 Tax=Arenibaculum pallidiluteum TaxID=2812559 RepID=UPI001A960C5F|nr:amidase [Arenibaculum pallidiluteum]
MSDPALLTLAEASAALEAGSLTAAALVDATLARIEALNPSINAFIAVEAEEARAAAAAADARRAAGRALSPLDGVPLAHKDMFYREGRVCTCGSALRRDWRAPVTATVISRLSALGAIQLGTLNMAEFAFGPTGHNAYLGAARNPWDRDRVTGGSSSGSAAAVAGRLAFAALGSDTGGSIRTPAHFCGLAGMKPTWGRVSRAGAMPLSPSMDTIGPLARTVEDVGIVLRAICGPDAADPTAADRPPPEDAGDVAGLRLGMPENGFEATNPEIADAVAAVADALARLAASVRTVRMPDLESIGMLANTVIGAEAAAHHAAWLRERPDEYTAQVRTRLSVGLAIPATAYIDALRARRPALDAFLAGPLSQVDALICPAVAVPAPGISETDVAGSPRMAEVLGLMTRYTRPFSYLGLPALSVPAGFTTEGLPLGVQLVGRPFAEGTLLRLGRAYERQARWHERIPPGFEGRT